MIRFGGPVFMGNEKTVAKAGESHGAAVFDPEALARKHVEKGFTAAYAPQLDVNDSDKIRQTRKAFEKAGVVIAEAGYWENLLDTKEDNRRRNKQKMLETLYIAEELGARCTVNIIGSYCEGHGTREHVAKNFSEDAFCEAVDNARYFIDQVKPKTACFTYEIYQFSNNDSPEGLERLLKAVDRPQFGVHLDLVNMVNSPRAYFSHLDLLRDAIRRVGNRIVSSHVKDVRLTDGAITVLLNEVPAGQGIIDIATYVKEVNRLPHMVPMMMEHLASEEAYDAAAAHIRACAASEGITL
jgi:sugar phosphate isomerase/epimerase